MNNRRTFLSNTGRAFCALFIQAKTGWSVYHYLNQENQLEMAKKNPYNEHLNRVLESHRFSKSTKQVKKLNNKFEEIKLALDKHYGGDIYSPYKTGSIPKGTAISDYFDLDMLVPFKYNRFEKNYRAMFLDLHKTLQRAGFDTRMQNVSIGVRLKLSSTREIYIDVVPGAEINRNNYESSGGDLVIHVERKKEKLGPYIKTNIKRQFKYIKGSPENTRNIIKLLKIWKVTNNVRFKSFILELITIKALKSQPSVKGLYPNLRLVMQYIVDYFTEIRLEDPGNKNNNVMDILSPRRKEQLAGRVKNMLKRLDREAEEGKMSAIKEFFPR